MKAAYYCGECRVQSPSAEQVRIVVVAIFAAAPKVDLFQFFWRELTETPLSVLCATKRHYSQEQSRLYAPCSTKVIHSGLSPTSHCSKGVSTPVAASMRYEASRPDPWPTA